MRAQGPHVVVLSSLFPSEAQPHAGLFIRERMRHVAEHLPVTVVSPRPWFPFQSLVRLLRPGFRPDAPALDRQAGLDVHRPRFLSFPAVLKRYDGFLMALGSRATVRKLKREGRCDILDAHFGYPDGYAASLLGRWLGVPYTVTFRGTEPRHAADPKLAPRLREAVRTAQRVFAVSGSLASLAVELGAPESRTVVVGNGVDVEKFAPMDRAAARHALGLPQTARVLVTVGGLVERKGFHRVIDLIPELAAGFPDLHYLVVGGASPEGDWSERLHAQVARLGLQSRVHFLGAVPPERLKLPLSAADVFVLATSNEGWANVLLEAMACGLPVVTTDVGGNAEVVSDPALGAIVPFGERAALGQAIADALVRQWDRAAIRAHAARHAWGDRAAVLAAAFRAAASEVRVPARPAGASQQPVS